MSRVAVENATAALRGISASAPAASRAAAGAADSAPKMEALVETDSEGLPRADEAPTSPRSLRENPAARLGHDTREAAVTSERGNQRNFLSVGTQRVGERGPQLGTDVAKGIQPMPANATELPPTANTLSADESAVAPVGAATDLSAAGSARTVAEPGPARAVAVETIRQLQEVAERARDTGRNHVEFQLRTPNDEGLRVNLRWHDGVVHARFVTESTEMQQALSREWIHAAPRLAEKGLKFDQPSFEHHERSDHQSSAQDGHSFAQQRHSSRGQERTFELAGTSGRAASAPSVAARPTTSHSSGTAPLDRTVPLPRPATGVTNLRAWA